MVDVIIIKDADEETIKRILNGKKTTSEQETSEKIPLSKIFGVKKQEQAEQEIEPEPDLTEKIINKGRPKKFIPFKGNHKIVWAKSELKTLKQYYIKGNPDWKLLQQLLPNRTESAIKWKASQLKICKKYSKKQVEKQNDKPKKGSQWTKEEDDILRENYSKEDRVKISKIRKLMPHRTKGSIMVRACELKITNKNRHRAKYHKKTQKKEDGRKHRIVPRSQIEAGLKGIKKYHKFTKERSTYYQKTGYNEPDSRRMAMAEWHKFKGHEQIQTTAYKPTPEQKKAVVPENFPEFDSISHDFQALIEGITKHIIANKGTKLSYPNTKDILDISDGRDWHDFVAEFMTKSKAICDYFNVLNKFKHIREQDKYDVIIYDS